MRQTLDLPGWDERSVWGFDAPAATYFAQLWPNGSMSDDPVVWLSGQPQALRTVDDLARAIAPVVALPAEAVSAALDAEPPRTPQANA
jgi:hypothetical protein